MSMVALLQRITVFGLITLALLWAWWASSQGRFGWAVGGAAIILLIHAELLAVQFLLMWIINRKHEVSSHAPLKQVFQAWLKETLITWKVFCWWQPFRSNAICDQWCLNEAAATQNENPRRAVLLIHGFFCNRGSWMPLLRQLKSEGQIFAAVNLEPVFGSIDNYGPQIDEAVSRLIRATGCPPLVVAHSMGGLAVRAWLRQSASDDKVHHIITIGSPHRGTWLGKLGRSVNAIQMRLNSEWLTSLERDEPLLRRAKFTCFYSDCDNIVFPPSTARLPDAQYFNLSGEAHLEMAYSERLWNEILFRLQLNH